MSYNATTRAGALAPPEAYMLADHLDAALAAGEDILSTGAKFAVGREPGLDAPEAVRSAVELVRAFELALITRVLKAREWSQKMSKQDNRFRLPALSFMGGSAALVDALAEFADATDVDFETGDGICAYFRSRALIESEAANWSPDATARIGEGFRVAGRIELGPLLDMIAAYLDALEVHFLLFAPNKTAPANSVSAAGTHAPA